MMDYMYRGEVNISQDQLAALLKAAESLQIKGLSDSRSGGPMPSQAHKSDGKSHVPAPKVNFKFFSFVFIITFICLHLHLLFMMKKLYEMSNNEFIIVCFFFHLKLYF
jgi:hypothetical protein